MLALGVTWNAALFHGGGEDHGDGPICHPLLSKWAFSYEVVVFYYYRYYYSFFEIHIMLEEE